MLLPRDACLFDLATGKSHLFCRSHVSGLATLQPPQMPPRPSPLLPVGISTFLDAVFSVFHRRQLQALLAKAPLRTEAFCWPRAHPHALPFEHPFHSSLPLLSEWSLGTTAFHLTTFFNAAILTRSTPVDSNAEQFIQSLALRPKNLGQPRHPPEGTAQQHTSFHSVSHSTVPEKVLDSASHVMKCLSAKPCWDQ